MVASKKAGPRYDVDRQNNISKKEKSIVKRQKLIQKKIRKKKAKSQRNQLKALTRYANPADDDHVGHDKVTNDDGEQDGKKKINKNPLWKKKKKQKTEDEDDETPIEYVKQDFKPRFNQESSDSEESLSDNETRQMVIEERKKKSKGGGFQSMGLCQPILKAIMRKGYRVPTPIQRKTMPLILSGKDVVAMARTGSGKTAAFLVPMLERLKSHCAKTGARALVLSPTRELAMQTYKFAREFAKFTDLRINMILGGDSMESQFETMHSSPDIIIATPGRLLHVLVEMKARLSEVEYVVFDEADRLFELGFQEQLNEIVNRLPEHRQTLLFSATLPKLLVDFAKAGLSDPELVRLDVETKLSELLKIHFITCRDEDKDALLVCLMNNVIDSSKEMSVIFAATRHHVEFIHEMLKKFGIESTYVYSSLDPEARKENIALFRSKKVRVMVVTDLAARGIDIPLLENVINYNFPCKSKLFVHRVGRVARAGKTGIAYSLVCPEENAYLVELHQFLDRPLKFASKDGNNKEDGLIGSVLQSDIDEEKDVLKKWEENNYEIQSLRKVCKNAYKQYVRSRPQPSSDAVKQAKKLSFQNLQRHPVFKKLDRQTQPNGNFSTNVSDFLESIKSFKPKATIFEINSTRKNEACSVMQEKRKVHDSKVNRKTESVNNGAAIGEISVSTGKEFKDDKFYLSYKPDHYESEKQMALDGVVRKDLDAAVLDVIGDEDHIIRKTNASMKWDRKKKKFVNETGRNDGNKKKIKTESGAYIPASYSTDLYKKWQQKKQIGVGDDDENDGIASRDRPNLPPSRTKNKVRNELKRPEQILKVRKKAEKKKQFIKSRREQKMSRSRGGGEKGRPSRTSGKNRGKGGRRRR